MKTFIQFLVTLTLVTLLLCPPWSEPSSAGQPTVGHRLLWHVDGRTARIDFATLGSELAVLALLGYGIELADSSDDTTESTLRRVVTS